MKRLALSLLLSALALALPAAAHAAPTSAVTDRSAKVEIIESTPDGQTETVTMVFLIHPKQSVSQEISDGTTSYDLDFSLAGPQKGGIGFKLELERGSGPGYHHVTQLEGSGTIKLGSRTVVSSLRYGDRELSVALTLK